VDHSLTVPVGKGGDGRLGREVKEGEPKWGRKSKHKLIKDETGTGGGGGEKKRIKLCVAMRGMTWRGATGLRNWVNQV